MTQNDNKYGQFSWNTGIHPLREDSSDAINNDDVLTAVQKCAQSKRFKN